MKIQMPAPNPMQQIGLAGRGFVRLYEGRLKELGFAVAQIPVLVALKHSEGLPQAELVRIVRVEQSSMAQLLGRMERDGMIERVADPADRRSRLITLTDAARKRMPAARAVMQQGTAQALEGFSEEEEATLLALLLRVNANLERAGE
ncbi:MarR family transcriptional regulator [Pseudomonas sp. NS1(2017)]|jgi:MarR family transcriptional regulator, transcriptional regulator for hemolysin|uniref:MarR family transcriptional regulator n=2 Tax=Pseudomonas TaxID=286 RepID=A0A7Y8G5T6_9PSED|nr:MarR family transcriptional regulator [Pseudomonas sp. NS1(2017)]NWD84704.1 MarR family transcriptional regulator [Pseudomonas reactans]NWE91208.1 MarR family transcriptional regulator [Pseudomonas reactans]